MYVRTQDLNTVAKNGANAAIAYSSVSGGVPIVGLRASKPQLIGDIRTQIEGIIHGGQIFQILPKAAAVQKYVLTIMLWSHMSMVSAKMIPTQLLERNRGLTGGVKILKCKTFRSTATDKQGNSMAGARLVQISGCPTFLASLYKFPRSHRFGLGPDAVIIRGGERTVSYTHLTLPTICSV